MGTLAGRTPLVPPVADRATREGEPTGLPIFTDEVASVKVPTPERVARVSAPLVRIDAPLVVGAELLAFTDPVVWNDTALVLVPIIAYIRVVLQEALCVPAAQVLRPLMVQDPGVRFRRLDHNRQHPTL